jgi:hypothetical protein
MIERKNVETLFQQCPTFFFIGQLFGDNKLGGKFFFGQNITTGKNKTLE